MPEPLAPRETKVRYSKRTSFYMALSVVFSLFLITSLFDILHIRFLEEMETKTIDMRFWLRGSRQPQAPVKIVAVDDKSLAEFGQWPWPRTLHAQLARRLKENGAKCVFYDVLFAEPEKGQERLLAQLEHLLASTLSSKGLDSIRERTLADLRRFEAAQNGDREFALAIQETGNVYLPIVPFFLANEGEGRTPAFGSLHLTEAQLLDGYASSFHTARALLFSIPELQENAADSGHIGYRPESDGIYRLYPTVVAYQDKLIPSLPLQVARAYLGDKNPIKVYERSRTEVAGRKIPIQRGGYAFINYCGPSGAFQTFSACDVLKGRIQPAELKDSAVLVGVTAAGLFDLRPTPFLKAFPGVEMNANIIENVISGNFLSLAPDSLKFALALVLALLLWAFIPRLTPTQGTLFFVTLCATYIVAASLVFSRYSLVVNLTYPLLSGLAAFVLLTTYKFRTEVRHGRYLKQMFQSMVAPTVVEEILRLPGGIELGGEEKDLTVMFSDIRGFTTFSERHSPPEVVGILNEYLTQMTGLILKTEGTLDKYIGDAIMAFWGAPAPQHDHATRACQAALGMVDLLHATLHPKWEREGKEKLQIGIGLNSGGMVVGFVGSEHIKNYTLVGDAVNLGSRLEAATKEYKVEILMSETTQEQVKAEMVCRELDLLRVKGKTQPIRIYELLDLRSKVPENTLLKVQSFEEGLGLYRAQEWEKAAQRFRACLEIDPQDGPAGVFLERCQTLKKNPPGQGWDGVFVMVTK